VAPRWIGPSHVIMGTGRSAIADRRPHRESGRTPISALRNPNDDRAADLVLDRATVDAVLAGDREAFRRLVERESGPVVRACHRILGDLHDAEDAAQETFVTAYRSLASWRGEGPFGAWLTRIAVRIALRQAGRRKTIAWRDPVDAEGGATRGPVTVAIEQASIAAAPTTDPIALALRAERATDVRAALTALPEPYREVLTLRFFGEQSLEEIARQTGRPLGTVKTHLHRGLLRLRDVLAEGGGR
jgi:RNA polymerase sigma-70 factor, ECF subfamily